MSALKKILDKALPILFFGGIFIVLFNQYLKELSFAGGYIITEGVVVEKGLGSKGGCKGIYIYEIENKLYKGRFSSSAEKCSGNYFLGQKVRLKISKTDYSIYKVKKFTKSKLELNTDSLYSELIKQKN